MWSRRYKVKKTGVIGCYFGNHYKPKYSNINKSQVFYKIRLPTGRIELFSPDELEIYKGD